MACGCGDVCGGGEAGDAEEEDGEELGWEGVEEMSFKKGRKMSSIRTWYQTLDGRCYISKVIFFFLFPFFLLLGK